MKSPDEFDASDFNAKWSELSRQLDETASPQAGRGPRDYTVPDNTSGFVPPNPGWTPVRPRTVLGAGLLFLGLVGVVVVVVTRGPSVAGVLTALVAVAGFGVLVSALPRRRAPRDDDGAQV